MTAKSGTSRRTMLIGSAAAIAAMLALPALTSQPAQALEQSVIDDAKQEGSVTFYSVVPQEAAQSFIDAFQAKYDITLDYQRLTSGPMGQRYAAEAEAGAVVADVVAMTDVFFMRSAAENGWLAPMADQSIESYPEQFVQEYYATAQLLPYGVTYNTTHVQTKPESWDVLIDPQYKGRIALVDPRAAFVNIIWYYSLQQTMGDDFLAKLRAQEPTFVQSGTQAVQMAVAGAVAIAGGTTENIVGPFRRDGAPVDLVFMDPTIAAGIYTGVSAEAPHPNAASVLMSFLLSEEGQALYNLNNVSPLGELPGTLPLPETTEFPLDDAKAAEAGIISALGF
ncbi:MAG: ABC transporter substrate-binding protein [Rhizobiaceae bacterium]